MPRSGIGARLRYRFDNLMSRGAPAMIIGLAIVFILLVAGFALIAEHLDFDELKTPSVTTTTNMVMVTNTVRIRTAQTNVETVTRIESVPCVVTTTNLEHSYGTAFWQNLMRFVDSGTMTGDRGSFAFFTLLVTIIGIVVLSTLIGILSSGIESTLERLRKGRSRVIEKNHSVILGWSDQVLTIIPELMTANESRRRPCIVILGDRDKIEMDDTIREKIGATKNTRIVTRQGNPADPADLALASLDTARSIIILSPETGNPDASVIKSLLAITNNPARKRGKYHIVAEIRDPKNMDIAAIVGRDEVELVLVGDLISRIVAQTCRQSGLSIVYTELLDFGGDEIYFREEPALVGKTYGECLFLHPKCALFGLAQRDRRPRLNPPASTRIASGDRLILIAEDDSVIRLPRKATVPPPETDAIRESAPPASMPERTLILGWNWRAPIIIRELCKYTPPGSDVLVIADRVDFIPELETLAAALPAGRSVRWEQADTTARPVLDGLDAGAWDHIIILCYSDSMELQEADSATLITLLHLRDIADKTGKHLSIISEMQDVKNRDLAEVARVNDFIVSDKLISLMLSQISENKQLNAFFADMFDPDGSEIYLKPVEYYVATGREIAYTTLLEAGRRRDQSVIGYKIAALAHDSDQACGVVINPEKSTRIRFAAGDMVIVAAED